MAEAAIIFDVDGVLLELTRAEEEVFFEALSRFVPTESLSRDWNSYAIRNDDDIIAEILQRNDLPLSFRDDVKQHYIALLQHRLALPHPPFGHLLPLEETGEGGQRPDEGTSTISSETIEGASQLLDRFQARALLGIATANLLDAAWIRLRAAGLWNPVKALAQGADGGGHKHHILERLLQRLKVPRQRVVYVGDNLNDLEAGKRCGVNFIGFSTDPTRLAKLRANGAEWTSENHTKTAELIEHLLFAP
jgi:phosphoglycolate phosphatase-like HAD superfamily hydrolase